jgi:hypothetical protein
MYNLYLVLPNKVIHIYFLPVTISVGQTAYDLGLQLSYVAKLIRNLCCVVPLHTSEQKKSPTISDEGICHTTFLYLIPFQLIL